MSGSRIVCAVLPVSRTHAMAVALLVLVATSCRDVPTQPSGRRAAPRDAQASTVRAQDLVITPITDTIFIGQSLDLTVANSNGTAINKQAVWTSSDTAIAKVVSTGMASARVTGSRLGTVTITAASGQKQGTNTTTVVLVPVRSVTVSPDSSSIQLTDSVQYTATPRDSAGNPLGDRVVSWSVGDTAVAIISPSGLAHPRARGSTRVLATVEGVVGYASSLRVRVPELSVSAPVAQDSANVGDTLSIAYVVRNAGDAIQRDSVTVRVGIRNVFGGIVTAVRRSVPSLGLIGPYTDAVRILLPSGLAPGNYTVVAYVDCRDLPLSTNETTLSGCLSTPSTAGVIPEGIEVDNSAAANLVVRGPDLVAVGVTAPDSIFTRTQASTSFEIKNTGSATTTGFNMIVALYDASAGTYPVAIAASLGGLGSRETRLVPFIFGVPAGLDPTHVYQLVGYADCSAAGGTAAARLADCLANPASAGTIGESNENNNSVKRGVAVASNVVRIDAQPDSVLFTAFGDTTSLRATAYDRANAPVSGVSFAFASLNPAVVSATGPLLRAVSSGNTRIVVSAEGRTDSTRVYVSQRVSRVTVFPDSITLRAIGDTSGFAANAFDHNGNIIVGAPMTWMSLDPSVADIVAPGKVIATGIGRARIVATSDFHSDTGIVNVAQTVARVVLSPDALVFQAIGDTARLASAVYDSNNNVMPGATVSWTVTEPIVASVSSSGLVTARGNGTSLVIATSGGRADTASITVYLLVTRVVAKPDTTLIEALTPMGQYSAQLTAISYDHNGNVVDGAWVTWASLDPAIATITEHGGVAALANGQARITATNYSSGVADTVVVIVRQRATSIHISPETTLVATGGTATVTPIFRDSLGNVITETRVVTWTSLDPGIATVNGTSIGQVIGVSAGTARIVASIEGHADTAVVVVSATSDEMRFGKTSVAASGAPSMWLVDETKTAIDVDGRLRAIRSNEHSASTLGTGPEQVVDDLGGRIPIAPLEE